MPNNLQRPLRIMMVTHSLRAGGAERQLGYLARGLEERGHRVAVAVLRGPEGPASANDLRGPVCRPAGRGNYDPRLLFRIWRTIRRERPDLIQTWNPQTDILGGAAAVFAGCPWIIREPISGDFYRSGWKPRLRRLLAARASAVIANSAGGRRYWLERYPGKFLAVVRNGLPLEAIREVEPVARERLGLNPGQKLVLYAGRLTRQKRVDLILDAFSRIGPDPDAVLVICGEGEEEERLKNQAQELGLARRVRFEGVQAPERVWALMKSADLFVSFSDFEGMPNTVMEAMACGTSLLVSDIPAHREILDENAAALVDQGDAPAAAAALESLLSDCSAGLRRLRTAAARQTAMSWSISEMVSGYEKIYRLVPDGTGDRQQ